MDLLTIYPTSINQDYIDQAVDTMRDGGVIIYPTDTLYALGCDALNNAAVERICRLKGINPAKEFLSIICADISMASEYARIDNHAFRKLKEYLPGPFTFILPASSKLPKVFKGRKTVGVRIPDNEIALQLSRGLGGPVLTTSVKGEDWELASAESLALKYESEADLVIDGGEGESEPSTVVSLLEPTAPQVLRQGKGEFEG